MSQPVTQKYADNAQGLGGGVQVPDAVDEPVWHSHPYIKLGVDAGSNGALDIPPRVVQQHLIISHVDADWWQPRQISINWRGQGILGIAQNPELKIMKAPKPLDAFSYLMAWHPRMDSDAAHIWLRHIIVKVAGTIKETTF